MRGRRQIARDLPQRKKKSRAEQETTMKENVAQVDINVQPARTKFVMVAHGRDFKK